MDEKTPTFDFRESFLKANANLDFIAYSFADVLRDLMRAFAATDPSMAIYRAAEHMKFVSELLERTEEDFGYRTLFSKAVEILSVERENDVVDRAIVDAARSGVKFLVERSCADNLARGRASRREHEFLDDIRRIDETREEFRRQATGTNPRLRTRRQGHTS